MSALFCVVVFAEGEFQRKSTFKTIAEARAYCQGIETGSGLYGAGSCAGYVLPNDWADMQDGEDQAEIAKAAPLPVPAVPA